MRALNSAPPMGGLGSICAIDELLLRGRRKYTRGRLLRATECLLRDKTMAVLWSVRGYLEWLYEPRKGRKNCTCSMCYEEIATHFDQLFCEIYLRVTELRISRLLNKIKIKGPWCIRMNGVHIMVCETGEMLDVISTKRSAIRSNF